MDTENETQPKEKRVRIVRVSNEDVLALFQAASRGYERIAVPKFKKLPRGYDVLSVHTDYMRGDFAFLVQHEEFQPVPPGALIQVIDGGGIDCESTIYVKSADA